MVPAFGGNKPRGQGAADRIGRTLIRTPPAVCAGIKVQHVLPGKILKFFDPERFHVKDFFLLHVPSDGLDRSLVQLHEIDIGQGRDHMEMFPQGQQA